MTELVVFAENLVYHLGGATRSAYLLTQQLEELPDVKITAVSGVAGGRYGQFGKYPYRDIVEIPVRKLPPFLFLQHLLNRRRLGRYFRSSTASLLFANAQSSPVAINSFNGAAAYFIHDEVSLNVYRTYEKRLWKRVKFVVRFALDFPFFCYYCARNKKAMRKAKLVVANSEYVARRARERFGVDPVVMYPQIDVEALSRVELPPLDERPYILMVGGYEAKGVATFRRIASAMPEHEFLLVGRSYTSSKQGNLATRGFAQDVLELYRQAKLVLLPSECEETFGMVSVEAAALGIPTIVSQRGGLPETVPSSENVISDYRNPERWVEKIRSVLADYERHSRAAREHASRFDMRRQVENLLESVRAATGIELR